MQAIERVTAVRPAQFPGQRRRRVGLTGHEEAQLRAALRRTTPSEPWVEVQFRSIESTDERGAAVVRRVHDPRAFPPGGAGTAMVRCPACGVFTPPGAMEDGVCLDHADHAEWGPSPSAQAIRGLQYRNLRMTEAELPSESEAALRREIQRFERRKR